MFSSPLALAPERLMPGCTADAAMVLGIKSLPALKADAPSMSHGTNVLAEEVPDCPPK